jgi:hypothetical protein
MNPRIRFRETLVPILESLTISPVEAAFSATGPQLDREFIHLDIAEDGRELKSRLSESGWQSRHAEQDVTTFHLGDSAVQLILRTGVKKS